MLDLDAMIKLAGMHARDVLITRGARQLAPLYHLFVDPPGSDVLVPCGWSTVEEKLAVVTAVREVAHKVNARALMFVTEAWVRKVDRPLTSWHAARVDITTPPSQHPDRVEVVFAVATNGKETRVGQWQIVRDRPGGSIIALVQEKDTGGRFEGRMLDGILPC